MDSDRDLHPDHVPASCGGDDHTIPMRISVRIRQGLDLPWLLR